MAKSGSQSTAQRKDPQKRPLPSAREIMTTYVNDNTPGYFYWFTRITAYSIVSYIVIDLIVLYL